MDEPIELLCSACERPIRAGARFCSACGRTHAAEPPGDTAEPAGEPPRLSLAAVVGAQLRELSRIAWLYGLLLLSCLIFSWLTYFDGSPWSGVAMQVFDAALIVGYALARPEETRALLGAPRVTLAAARTIALATCGCLVVLLGYFELIAGSGLPMQRITDEYIAAGWPVWAMFVLASGMPAVFEELGFRGVIQGSLERVFNASEALIIQAALFSVVHLSPAIFASHFLFGMYFGWLRNQTRSLYPGVLTHACWNAYCLADELYWT